MELIKDTDGSFHLPSWAYGQTYRPPMQETQHTAQEIEWQSKPLDEKVEILRQRIERLERDMWPIR